MGRRYVFLGWLLWPRGPCSVRVMPRKANAWPYKLSALVPYWLEGVDGGMILLVQDAGSTLIKEAGSGSIRG